MARHIIEDKDRCATLFGSGNEAVENGRKGGIASGEARRAKKNREELARLIAEAPIKSTKAKKKLEEIGIYGDDKINDAMIVAAVYFAAASGDIKAVEKWEKWTGKDGQNSGVQIIDDL